MNNCWWSPLAYSSLTTSSTNWLFKIVTTPHPSEGFAWLIVGFSMFSTFSWVKLLLNDVENHQFSWKSIQKWAVRPCFDTYVSLTQGILCLLYNCFSNGATTYIPTGGITFDWVHHQFVFLHLPFLICKLKPVETGILDLQMEVNWIRFSIQKIRSCQGSETFYCKFVSGWIRLLCFPRGVGWKLRMEESRRRNCLDAQCGAVLLG